MAIFGLNFLLFFFVLIIQYSETWCRSTHSPYKLDRHVSTYQRTLKNPKIVLFPLCFMHRSLITQQHESSRVAFFTFFCCRKPHNFAAKSLEN